MAPQNSGVSATAQGIVQDADRSTRIVDASQIDWMGPQNALDALAPLGAVKGRANDYMVGANLQTTPRSDEAWTSMRATMSQLRFLADACEVVRILIETRKDQLTGLNWRFRKRDSKIVDSTDQGVRFLNEFFTRPDRENDFDTWLRMWVEDLCVLDAPAIHVSRYTDQQRYGQVASLEIIDGSTIKPLINELGRRPAAPLAAYAHILHGIPATHYSAWDLIYTPRNKRPMTMYGFSPVEQIKTHASMAIRRLSMQLGYFTAGNAPDCIIPMSGTADQVAKFQVTFDAQTMGGQKTGKIIFVPADNVNKILLTKDQVLADKFDELIYRIACAAFAESPTPFVSQVNRATAETAQETATREGLHVQIKHITDVLNHSIIQHPMMLNMPDYEIYVAPEPMTDIVQVATIVVPAVAGGIMRVDEARDMMGLVGNAPAQPVPAPAPQQEAQQQGGQVGRAMHIERRMADESRARAMVHETPLADKVGGWLQRMAEKVGRRMGQMHRAGGGDPLDAITGDDLDDIQGILSGTLETVAGESSVDAAAAFLSSPGLSPLQAPLRSAASQAALERGAWLVGRRIDDSGNVVASANPEYSITDEMRESIRGVTAQAEGESWTTDQFTSALQDSAGFARTRAATIARTEIVNAHESGKLTGWKAAEKASGQNLIKRSILASNDNHARECVENAASGWHPVDEEFPSGDEGAPFHPNCMCTTVARKAAKQ